MKKIITLALTGLALLLTSNTFAQVGFGTNLPNKSAAVDIVSSTHGLLIPRIDIANLNDASPVTNPANSLFVYNTGATNPAEEGFYYWDADATKWVKFVSGNNVETTSVTAGTNVDVNTSTIGNNTDYEVSIKAAGTDGYVLVTNEPSPGVFTTEWVDPATFVNSVINVDNGLTLNTTTSTVELGGTLDKATTITTDATTSKTLAITGLENEATLTTEKVVIMDANGILKTTSISNLVNGNAEDMTLSTALEFTTGDGIGAVLQAVEIGVADESITATQIATDAVTSDEIADDAVIAADINADVAGAGLTQNTTTGALEVDVTSLTGDGTISSTDLTVTGGANSTLEDVTLEIADDAVEAANINADVAGTGLTKNTTTGALDVDVTAISGDGEITSSDLTVTGGANSTFTDVDLEIAADAVTTAEILDGTITTGDIANAGNDQILTTDGTGTPTWVDQSTLVSGNETVTTLSQNTTTGQITYVNENGTPGVTAEVVSTETGNIIGIGTDGGAFLDAAAVQGQQETVTLIDGTNTTVNSTIAGNNTQYSVNVSNTDIQAAQLTTEVTAGTGISVSPSTAGTVTTYEVAADLSAITLAGDVTGAANATTVEAIQGTAVAATAPTTEQVLQFDGTSWTPTTLDGSAITGKQLTSTSLAIPANTAVLEDLAIEIKAGTQGTVLTTIDDGSGTLITSWETPNSLVEVDNGLHKDATTNEVYLGGALTEATAITTTSTETLAVEGLQAASAANSMVVVDNTSGVLSTIKRSVVANTATSLSITSIPNYSAYVLKATVLADITGGDVNITLPAASADNNGQVINIKVDQSTGVHYVNIEDSAGTLITYGSLPYQGWILTSTGSKWVITSRY